MIAILDTLGPIVWTALLSSGAHAHATADAVREMGHVAAQAEAAGAEAAGVGLDHGAAEPCGQGHCGHAHATGLLPAGDLRFSDAGTGGGAAPPPTELVGRAVAAAHG